LKERKKRKRLDFRMKDKNEIFPEIEKRTRSEYRDSTHAHRIDNKFRVRTTPNVSYLQTIKIE